LKETFKFIWRRLVFYLGLISLIIYIKLYPQQMDEPYCWLWLVTILWYELDVTQSKNSFLIQALNGICFSSSFVSTIGVIILCVRHGTFISDLNNMLGASLVRTWVIIAWISFLQPLWSILDIFLHRDDYILRHRFSLRPSRNVFKYIRRSLLVLWWFLSLPILILIWYFVSSDSALKSLLNSSSGLIIGILLPVHILSIFSLLAAVYKFPKKEGLLPRASVVTESPSINE